MTPLTTLQLASRLAPWIGVTPPELPPADALDALVPEAQAHRDANPDDAQAITLNTAVRSLLEARLTLDLTGELPVDDQKIVGHALGMFADALRAEYGEPS